MSALHVSPHMGDHHPLVGAHSDGQAIRGIVLGAKLGMALTTSVTRSVRGDFKTFFVYAGMTRFNNVKQTKLNLLACKREFIALFEELLAERPALTYFKAYYRNLSVSDNGAFTVLVCEDGRNENIASERAVTSDFDVEIANRLKAAFNKVDFTFTFRKRKDWLTKDISSMTGEHAPDDENIGNIKRILQPTAPMAAPPITPSDGLDKGDQSGTDTDRDRVDGTGA